LAVWGGINASAVRCSGATGRDLPGQANQQDAAMSAAQLCRITVHISCKNARVAVPSLPRKLVGGSNPPHLLPPRFLSAAQRAKRGPNQSITLLLPTQYCIKWGRKVKQFKVPIHSQYTPIAGRHAADCGNWWS